MIDKPIVMFKRTIYQFCQLIAQQWRPAIALNSARLTATQEYAYSQFQQLPWHFRQVIYLLTLFFGVLSRHKNAKQQTVQIKKWQQSRFLPISLLIQFWQSLILFSLFSPEQKFNDVDKAPLKKGNENLPETAEIVVIGSGPSGAITAALLAEAGFEVLLLEEGVALNHKFSPFSAQEFQQALRYGGLGVMQGKQVISYLEGRCLGGGSEINSGLYLRPQAQTLQSWQEHFQLKNCSYKALTPYFVANEHDLSVSSFRGVQPLAGEKLALGAEKMSWQHQQVEKWRYYADNTEQSPWCDNSRAVYQSMSKSFIPRFIKAQGTLRTNSKVARIVRDNNNWRITVENQQAQSNNITHIQAKHVFVCAGAVQTPALLQRSQIKKNIGKQLKTSLIIKVIAQFDHAVNDETLGMPVQQVREFAPLITFACGISTKAQLALGLQHYPEVAINLDQQYQNFAVYSVIFANNEPEKASSGKVSTHFGKTSTHFQITKHDWRAMTVALKKLSHLLLAAGATRLFPVMKNMSIITTAKDIDQIKDDLSHYQPSLTALHLSSSCPMGEDKALCATNSYGQVFEHENLYINDASILCTYPGANPQATIMAIARRNTEHFIQQSNFRNNSNINKEKHNNG